MGDRCYMQLTCKKKDRSIFEELGFALEGESEEFSNCLEMVDLEANYGHAGDVPKDVVYFGTHDAGDVYGPDAFACDGKTYLEQPTDGEGRFVVAFDDEGNPYPNSLAEVKDFITHWNNVRLMLAKRRG
jgi:hypothetical protein